MSELTDGVVFTRKNDTFHFFALAHTFCKPPALRIKRSSGMAAPLAPWNLF